jgi:hypothetical protein
MTVWGGDGEGGRGRSGLDDGWGIRTIEPHEFEHVEKRMRIKPRGRRRNRSHGWMKNISRTRTIENS